jgi:hypothetical protein
MKTFIWMLLLFTLFATGCSETTDNKISDTEEAELIKTADETMFLINSGRLLRSTTTRDRLQTVGAIDRIKTSVALLAGNPQDRTALISLKSAYKFINKVFITERDQPRVNEVLMKGRSLMAKYAEIQGVPLDGLQWSLFSYRFSNTVSPFGSTDVPIEWGIQFVQQERYAIRARGTNNRAVLLTPTFDLSNVTEPAYSIRHSFRVEEAFPPQPVFNRSEIISKAFRAYVSTTYKDGDSFDLRNWQRISLGNLPQGLNFNTVDSGIIDLSRFNSQKITMAFVYDNNVDIFNHSLSWAIERFDLYGVSKDLKVQNRPAPFDPALQNNLGKSVWHHDFNTNQTRGLDQVTLEGNAAEFVDTERNGSEYVATVGRDANGTQLLYTPPINLEEVISPAIRVQHTINFLDEEFKKLGDIKMVVALDEEGIDIKDLQWETINFEKNNPPGGDWSIYTSEYVALPKKYAGQKIRVGWSHTSRAEQGSTPAWQLHDTWIRDIEEDLL